MNKKLAMIGAGVVAGSVLLMSSVYAGVGSAPGYNAYKSAIKNTAKVDNVTDNIKLSVVDNGKVLIQVDSILKTGKDDSTDSAAITLLTGDTKQSIQIFNQEDQDIIKTSNSDVYKIISADPEELAEHKKAMEEHRFEHDPAFTQEVEKVIDALVGNLKDYVTLEEDGAAKEIGLHLEGSQIPAIVNTVSSILIRESGKDHGEQQPELNPADTFGINVESIKDSLPKLAEDIKIESFSLDADVNADNLITNHTAEIQISGKDSQGTNHEVVVTLSVDSSDFNQTTPDTVDLTGKKVEHVESPFSGEGSKHWK